MSSYQISVGSATGDELPYLIDFSLLLVIKLDLMIDAQGGDGWSDGDKRDDDDYEDHKVDHQGNDDDDNGSDDNRGSGYLVGVLLVSSLHVTVVVTCWW